MDIPDWIDPHNWGKTWTEWVAAHCIASCHTAHNLDSLQPHPFQILVIETIVRDHLSIVIENFNTGSCLCAHHPPTTVLFLCQNAQRHLLGWSTVTFNRQNIYSVCSNCTLISIIYPEFRSSTDECFSVKMLMCWCTF